MYKEFNILELKLFESKLLELFIDAYVINFQITRNEAKIICLEKIHSLEKYIGNGSAVVIGSIEDNNLIGVIWLYIHEYFGEKRLHVNQIVVDKEHRGKGIGKGLILEAEKRARNLDATAIDLFVSEINKGALNLYDGLGFETERRYMKMKLQVNKK